MKTLEQVIRDAALEMFFKNARKIIDYIKYADINGI